MKVLVLKGITVLRKKRKRHKRKQDKRLRMTDSNNKKEGRGYEILRQESEDEEVTSSSKENGEE